MRSGQTVWLGLAWYVVGGRSEGGARGEVKEGKDSSEAAVVVVDGSRDYCSCSCRCGCGAGCRGVRTAVTSAQGECLVPA